MTRSGLKDDVIYSSLGTDPDLGEIVDMFVDEIPDRVGALQRLFESGDREALRRTAHQLKGAAGSYGFDQLTPYAARLEGLVQDNNPEEEILQALDVLVAICQKVKAGAPDLS